MKNKIEMLLLIGALALAANFIASAGETPIGHDWVSPCSGSGCTGTCGYSDSVADSAHTGNCALKYFGVGAYCLCN
jgi:hypothetical protein